MSILEEILAWGSGLPPWQQDTIGRLFAKGELTAQDDNDLLALVRAAHGLPDAEKRVAKTLDAAHIVAPTDTGKLIQLTSLANVRNVNALAADQVLNFDQTGLTIVYGGNGSGKSGYSRALKRACRARDQSEAILQDARLPPGPAKKATARFEVSVDGAAPQVLDWIDGEAAPEELAAIAIFDAHCARAYLDEQGDYSYAPYGLDILSGFALACNRIKARLEEEQAAKQPSSAPFLHLLDSKTAVGKLLATLSGTTKAADVHALANLSVDETQQREQLAKSLQEENPKEKAAQLSQRAARLQVLAARCDLKLSAVSDQSIKEVRALVSASLIAKEAAALASQQFSALPGLLPGTGGDAWKDLFEAARAYAIESHPHQPFPNLGADTQCPLCQQPLGVGAQRLVDFEAFITAAAEKDWQQKRGKAQIARKAIVDAELSIGVDAALREELLGISAELPAECDAFEAALKQRSQAVKAACEPGGDWGAIDAAPVSPSEKLKPLCDAMRADAKALEALVNAEARAAHVETFKQLEARAGLAEVEQSVIDVIEKHKAQAALTKCIGAVKTTAISNKATELNEKVASPELETRLNAEFKKLDVGSLHVKLKQFGVKGKTFYKLSLELPGQQRPALILSEGEQRAVAIGSFLAEIGISGAKGGIVFDDPVSSLDHKRRELVANRLAEEAATRQVIVFTHDLYFLLLMEKEAQRLGISKATRSLHRTAKGYGVCDDKLPMGGMTSKARVGMLRDAHARAAAFHNKGDEEDASEIVAKAYGLLRITWERSIEDVLLRSVIARFSEGVSTLRLREVEVLDEDYVTIDAGMTKCSKFAAHDGAAIANVAIPTPDFLKDDIDAFDTWRKGVEARAEATLKRRK